MKWPVGGNYIFVMFTALNITSCGDERPDGVIGEPFVATANEFQRDAENHHHAVDLSSLTIQFMGDEESQGASESGLLARCTGNEIHVSQDFWDRSTDLSRKLILYHEMGHCILGRDHKDGFDPDKRIALSIMNSHAGAVIPNFLDNEEYYLNELFNP